MIRPTCAHPRKDGSACRAVAVIMHPELGPVCSRHEVLLAKEARQEPDLTAAICFRVSQEERETIRRAAEFVGLSVSQLVRRRVLEVPLPAPRPQRAEALLLKEWSMWGNNLNQMTHCLNSIHQDSRNEEFSPIMRNTFLAVESAKVLLRDCRDQLIRLCSEVRSS